MKNCMICQEPMKLVSSQAPKGKRRYNVSLFHCGWCDITESGTSADDHYNNLAKEDVLKLYQQQDENNI